ncbi:hypothetical protein [Paracraurococcus ruber]|uniref:Phage tail sheath protein n=1 Tax=Paracraurococcus ruber TaxID=77675 RepID=A0ABS1CRN0_9PROT|nr:hypothetical protein [Paracraurococcus ruber]MBK1657105.1 hypothetical protein [Paracraurococcus ruber]
MSATLLATPDLRLSLDATARPRAEAGFDLVLIGHAPGLHRPQAARPLADAVALAGFDAAAARLRGAESTPGGLHGVPLPLPDAESFARIFPAADSTPTQLGSRIAGRRAFLPRAVRDAFRAGAGRVWVVTVAEPPPGAEADAVLDSLGLGAAGPGDPARPGSLAGIGLALAIPDAALVALPDLERLLIAAGASRPDAPVPPREPPEFRPDRPAPPPRLFTLPPDGPAHAPPAPAVLLSRLALLLARWRPDMQALITLPDPPAAAVAALRDRLAPEGRLAALDRLQLLHPLLRGTDGETGTASGAIAGAIAAGAARDGPWRSIAGRPLALAAMPVLAHAPATVAALRAQGIGVLTGRAGLLRLDDEATPAPAEGAVGRPAEVVRFLGWLQRRLRRLGEALAFETLPDDGRTEIALRGFLLDLLARGALRGATAEDAFRLAPLRFLPEGAAGFEIRLAPSLPVEAIAIRLVATPAGLTVEAGLA